MRRQITTFSAVLALAAASLPGLALAQGPGQGQVTVTPLFVTQQPSGEWLARVFIGQNVQSATGDIIGNINDLVFDRRGQITTVVIGVGGFLGLAEKSVAVRFNELTFKVGDNGERVIAVALSKESLLAAPGFTATEKTTYDKAVDTAVDLKDQAVKKIDDMTKSPPPNALSNASRAI